jgi:hypothetical protein
MDDLLSIYGIIAVLLWCLAHYNGFIICLLQRIYTAHA